MDCAPASTNLLAKAKELLGGKLSDHSPTIPGHWMGTHATSSAFWPWMRTPPQAGSGAGAGADADYGLETCGIPSNSSATTAQGIWERGTFLASPRGSFAFPEPGRAEQTEISAASEPITHMLLSLQCWGLGSGRTGAPGWEFS